MSRSAENRRLFNAVRRNDADARAADQQAIRAEIRSVMAAYQRRKATMSMKNAALSAEDHRLFNAVASDDADTAADAVQQAIRDGANVNAVHYDSTHDVDATPLLKACEYGNDQIIRILLDAGADARWKDSYGRSAISRACYYGHLSAVQLLINHDNGLQEIVDDEGRTPLFYAIRRHNYDIVRLLLDYGANPNCVDQSGKTALMYACSEGILDNVRMLLAAGADVEARDESAKTALHHAANWGRIEVLRQLIRQYNANMFAVDQQRRTPFDLACNSRWSGAAVDHLLEMYGNKLTHDHGRLALHELCEVAVYSFAEDEEFHPPLNPFRIILPLGKLALTHLRTLLHTLDPELIRNRDDTGKLPIHVACHTNAPVQVLAVILKLDRNPTAALRIADFTGALPIHLLCGNATAATEYASVRYLMQSFPGSVAVQTNAGYYPFMMAAAAGASSASLNVIYELVRANPGLVVPK